MLAANENKTKSKLGLALTVSSIGAFFLWGFVSSIGPVSTAQSFVGSYPNLVLLALIIGPLSLFLGDVVVGIFSDLAGRKTMFLISLVLFLAGIWVVSYGLVNQNIQLLLGGIVIANFFVGGMEPPILSLIAEESAVKSRGFYLSVIPNFSNIGGALYAFYYLFYSYYSLTTSEFNILLIGTGTIVSLLSVVALVKSQDSRLWKEIRQGRNGSSQNDRHGKYGLGFIILSVFSISQYLTFGLMAYILAPIYFPETIYGGTFTVLMIFIALAGASIAGGFSFLLVNIGRKIFSVFAFLGGVVSTLAIFIMLSYLQNLILFLFLLLVNMMFSEFAWVSRTTMEPELAPNSHRGGFIGVIRVFPMISYPILAYYSAKGITVVEFVVINLILWGAGLAASIVWFIHGNETKDLDFRNSQTVSTEVLP